MNSNRLKNKLEKLKLTIGSWLTIPKREIIEIMSLAGFEWLAIDMEHSPISIQKAADLIAFIQSKNIEALVRVSSNDEVIIKKVLDAGAHGIIIPMINSEEDAKKAVNFSKYPPEGKRGVGLNRAQGYGYNFNKYKSWQKNSLVVIVQIEHIDAVNNLDKILRVDGIDGIIIGPYDLSASLGYPGEYNKKEVIEAIKKVELITKKYNKSLGFHVIESDSNFVKRKIKEGYNLISFSLDFFFLGDKVINEMKKLKKSNKL